MIRSIPILPAGSQPTSRRPSGNSAISLTALPPLALYVHIPWCVKKCPYCDFNSHEAREDIPEQQYIDTLFRDLEQALPQVWGRKVYTIFFGGGTPSLLSAEGLDRLMAGLRARLPLEHCSEVTLEANPGTFEAAKFRAYHESGINRLSIGIQSFNPKHLKALGRIHDENEALAAIDIAHRQFDNFNVDLMYGLPEQTLREAMRDIEAAIACDPPHLSAYHLTLEPNTLFHRYPPPLPCDELAADMQEMIEETLAGAGYVHYETSAFAKTGRECKHNLNYWQFGDYLGIGAGASSKLSFPDRIVRSLRTKQPNAYMTSVEDGKHILDEHEVTVGDLPFEFMMNALRLTDGFPLSHFTERTGLSLTVVQGELRKAEEKGLIVRDHATLKPTLRGQRFLNDLLQLFLPAEA